MSAAPQLARPIFAFEPADWLPASDAADRLNMNRNALTRKCQDQLADVGMAIFDRLPNGRKGWLIHRGYDRRLDRQADTIESADLDDFTDFQKHLAWA